MCKYEWEDTSGPIQCTKCGHNYVWWANYYTWKWKIYKFVIDLKTGKRYSKDKEIKDFNLPIRTV